MGMANAKVKFVFCPKKSRFRHNFVIEVFGKSTIRLNFIGMDDRTNNNALKRFFHSKRSLFESLQELSFVRGEKKLVELLDTESEPLDYPIPVFVPILLVWMFVILFPLALILDPGYLPGHEVNAKSIVGFYLPLFFTFCIFHMNQRVLVPNIFFKKKYFLYFVLNSIFIAVALFVREIAFFLLERLPGQSLHYFFHSYCFSAVKGHFSFWTVFFFAVLVCLVCVICVVYHVMLRQIVKAFVQREQKRASLQYELDFLKNQLSPHFLFNTLNNISTLIRFDPQKAESSMSKLSKLLRVMLYQASDNFIKVQEDVEILQKYADLEKLRLDESYDFKFDVSLDNPDRNIEPLIVMPLMENALKHSVNPLGKSFAHISIVQAGDEFHFHSENSNFPRKSQKQSSGLGLATFEKRMSLLYGGDYEYEKGVQGDVYVCDLKFKLKS